MKEPNLGHLAYSLLNSATALASILDQPIVNGCIRVNFEMAAVLIREMQIDAKAAADELLFIDEERKEVRNV